MKKAMIFLAIFGLILSGMAFAQTLPIREAGFEALKQITLAGIDRSIDYLNSLEEKVDRHPQISDSAAQSINESLNAIEAKLEEFKPKVEAVETLDDLRAIREEIKAYLMENKDAIKEQLKAAIIEIGEKAQQKAEEFKEKAEAALAILKLTCPSERATIEETEAQLEELQADIDELAQAITSQDGQAVKASVQKINTLAKEIKENLLRIKEACIPQNLTPL